MEIRINNAGELSGIMPQVFEALAGRRKIALYGEMGAGKTTFTAAFCRYLGVQDAVASPTFSLVNVYAFTANDGTSGLVHHLDLYRLKNTGEAFDIGIEEMLDDDSYCLIEWPQLIEAFLPAEAAKIEIQMLSETRRCVVIL